jgi:protocatechuate 3,4-dioxygenase beta subunit
VGPMPTQLPEAIPAAAMPQRGASRVGNSPFVLVQAKGRVECDFSLVPTVEVRNVQQWYFPHPGKYTARAEYVNKHSSYVDSQTGAVVKMEGVFLGSVKASPVEFNVTRSAAEGGFEISDGRALGRGGMLVLGENTAGEEGLTLSGTTVDQRGKPVAGVVLEITANKNSGLGGPGNAGDIGDGIIRKTIERQRSGADGKFEFVNLPPHADSYVLKATPTGNYVSAVVALSNKKEGNRKDLRVSLQEGVGVRGKVVDQNGRPLAEVQVRGVGQTVHVEDPKLVETGESPKPTEWWVANVRTDENGLFQLRGIIRAECRFGGPKLKQEVMASPSAGHADDGTWTVVVDAK